MTGGQQLRDASNVLSIWQNLNLVLNDLALLASTLTKDAPSKRFEVGADGKVHIIGGFGPDPDMAFFLERLKSAREYLAELKRGLADYHEKYGGHEFFLKQLTQDLAHDTMDHHRHAARHVFNDSNGLMGDFAVGTVFKAHSERFGFRRPAETRRRPIHVSAYRRSR